MLSLLNIVSYSARKWECGCSVLKGECNIELRKAGGVSGAVKC